MTPNHPRQMGREIKINKIPTGYLFTDRYTKGQLETLSIGDYGKRHNVKADFLGFHNEIHGVPNVDCMPLSEKWVITLSTQYGCAMNCTFCDVPNIKFKGNATLADLWGQLENARSLFPDVGYVERLNIHFARMGEPILNDAVFNVSREWAEDKRYFQDRLGLRAEVIHPVLTTSLPRRFKGLESRILEWCDIKNDLYNGQAGFQFSINSTCEKQRSEMFDDSQLPLSEFAKIAEKMPDPLSRKYCLNIAYSTDFEVDADVLASLFNPDKFMVKITPIHNNNACRANDIKTVGGYEEWEPYRKPEEDLKSKGFDVLVFVPSLDEEDGLVTCGNLILGGSTLKKTVDSLRIEGAERPHP